MKCPGLKYQSSWNYSLEFKGLRIENNNINFTNDWFICTVIQLVEKMLLEILIKVDLKL